MNPIRRAHRSLVHAAALAVLLLAGPDAGAGTSLTAETIFTARWEAPGPGGFYLNPDPGWRLAPEDFDLGDEILVPDAARGGFQFFQRATRTWREISVGTPNDAYIPWKGVRDRRGMLYYLPTPGLQQGDIRVVAARGGPWTRLGADVLRGYPKRLATNGVDRLSVVDYGQGVAIFTLQGELVRYVPLELRPTPTLSPARDGLAYTGAGELLVFYRVWETKQPARYGIQTYTQDGALLRDVPGPHSPGFIGVDRRGQVYTVDDQFRTVRIVTPEGGLKEELVLPKAGPVIADMSGAKNMLKVDADGTLYQLLGLQKSGLLLRRLTRR